MTTSDQSLFCCMTKAFVEPLPAEHLTGRQDGLLETMPTKRGLHWVVSRRSILKVFSDRMVCGDWKIPFLQIRKATLYTLPRQLIFFPCYLLVIETENQIYRFGLNGWNKFWKSELPFPVERKKGTVGYSLFSILLRLFVVGMLIYWIFREFLLQ